MDPLPRYPYRYEDKEEIRSFQEIIDTEPIFQAPIKETESINDFRYRMERLLRENVGEHPFLMCSKARVYLASHNLVGDMWKDLKELVEPYILFRYRDNMHPLKLEDKGTLGFYDFFEIMRLEKAKYRIRENPDWYDYSYDNPRRPENLAINHMSWEDPPYYLPRPIEERKRKREEEIGEGSVRVAPGSPGGNPDPTMVVPREDDGERESSVDPIPGRAYEEHPLMPRFEEPAPILPFEDQLAALEAEEEEEGNEGANDDDDYNDDDDRTEEEDPEEEDPEEEEEGGNGLPNGYESSEHYSISSSSSSSPSTGSHLERQIASDYYSDSQNELSNEDEKYGPGSRRL